MSTVSNVSSTGVYSYSPPSKNVDAAATAKTDTTANTDTAAKTSTASTVVSTNSSSSSALTYNAAGLMNAFQQANANKPATTGGMTQQAAKDAYIASQNAMNQALSALMSDSSSSSSTTDIFGQDTSNTDVMGLSGMQASTGSTSNSTALAAQNAYMDAQNAVTQSLGSLMGGGN